MPTTLTSFWQQLADWQRRHDCVLVSLLAAQGSSPQTPGARMAVSASRFIGTIGGGRLEQVALENARQMLSPGQPGTTTQWYTLGASMGQCCGGRVLLAYTLVKRMPQVTIFGAGHVGRELALILARFEVQLRVYDTEAKFGGDNELLGLDITYDSDLLALVPELPADSWVLVLSHSHQLDFDLVHALLQRDDLHWVGLIGSESKARNFRSRLRRRGLSAERLQKLQCPLGLAPIASKQPAAIAVATVAQLLAQPDFL